MDSFFPIEIRHQELVNEHFSKYPPLVSEHTFAGLFAWRGARHVEIMKLGEGMAFLHRRGDAAFIFGPPAGDIDAELLIREALAATGCKTAGFARVTERYALAAVRSGIEALEDRANFDYVYRREDLAELSGGRYHKKRNLIAQCLSQNRCEYEEIAPQNLAEVSDVMEEWCKKKMCNHDMTLCDEFIAVKETLGNYERLGLFGAAIRIDGKMAAFSIGEKLSPSTAVVHFEKALPEYKGLYQLMNQWFVRNHLAKFEFVNREQDMGLPGLRKAKESYFPDHYVKKYSTPSPPATNEQRCEEE